MQKKYTKGFTLIELLVVIAIIGLLSSVVMSSVNEARVKGADAAIKSSMSSIRSQAALIYDTDTNYNAVCEANSATQNGTIERAIASITTTNGGTAPVCGAPASGDAAAWAVATPLRTAGTFWCADSASKAGDKNAAGNAYDGLIADAGVTYPALADANDTECN